MEVRCPKCATVFEFDERQMRGAVATLKCSVCQHLFRLETTTSIQENQSRWMVRDRQTGDVLYFAGFDVLHRWILEGKVQKQDQISRTGDKWTALDDVGEFMPIFQVLDSISHLSKGALETPSLPSLTPAQDDLTTPLQPPPERNRARTMQQFARADALDHLDTGESTREFSRDEKLAQIEKAHAEANRQPTRPQQRSGPVPQAPAPQSQPHFTTPPSPSATGPQNRVTGPQPAFNQGQREPARTPMPSGEHAQPQRQPQQPAPEPARGDRIRLDTRMSGQAGGIESVREEPQEEWSLGDLSTVSGKFDAVNEEVPVQAPKKSRAGLFVAMFVVLLILGAGGYAWTFERDRVMALLGKSQQTKEVAEKDSKETEKGAAQPPEEKDPVGEAIAGMASSLEKAREAADTREAEMLATVIEESRPKLMAAVNTGESRAERHAKRSDIDSILKDARRARERDKHDKARDLYHDALDIDNRNIEAVTGLGWALLSMGRTESASVQFRRAISINSSYEDAYIGLGRAERAKGNLNEALKVYEGYLSRFPAGKKASIARYQRDQIRKALGM